MSMNTTNVYICVNL